MFNLCVHVTQDQKNLPVLNDVGQVSNRRRWKKVAKVLVLQWASSG